MKIVAINLKCGRFNQEVNIDGNTEEEIQAIINSYDKTKWIILKRN